MFEVRSAINVDFWISIFDFRPFSPSIFEIFLAIFLLKIKNFYTINSKFYGSGIIIFCRKYLFLLHPGVPVMEWDYRSG